MNWRRFGFCMLGFALALALGACGSLPAGVERPVSTSLPAAPDASPLARLAESALPAGAQSGFRLLPLGAYGLDARLALIGRATRTLDLQVYIMDNDESGRAVFAALRDAAQRGVRVRLLLDDLNSAGAEPLLEALVDLPNFEIRLFNPFCCARQSLAGRIATSLGDLPRLDHRMHNKLMIADGALAIVGGRNIADAYFGRDPVANFIDLDAIAAGRVVPQLGVLFDRYWNSKESFPAKSLVRPLGPESARMAALARLLPDSAAPIDPGLPARDLLGREPVGKELAANRLSLVPGLAYGVADQPSKRLQIGDELEDGSLMTGAVSQMLGTRNELVVSSPYLVPGTRGMAVMHSLQRKGVEMTLVTNSLSANDSALVNIGYARYRRPILRAGVRLYEISAQPSANASQPFFSGSSRGRLHAKLMVIDQEVVLLGSLNLDPRSARRNTELGVAIDSPALAREALRLIDAMKNEAYFLRLETQGSALAWVSPNEDDDQGVDTEPGVSPWNALQRLLLQPLVPEDLL
ncbi:phospholipase D family protein [Variovorax sp. J31P207]|uniref:phospholipase D-like domain-containing protein n=1 Tax=Variovorax sp. J31P207 TaxID=3053510 RepID=UPI002576CBE9|nr:phospholipase D family protein [Variovorax sp. J31P207]MDM0065780.1 phospholipase D family protein [Variovorax sp. J31P207]